MALVQPLFTSDYLMKLRRALVISVSLGFFVGIGYTSRHSVLVKAAAYLEALAESGSGHPIAQSFRAACTRLQNERIRDKKTSRALRRVRTSGQP